MKHRLIHHGEEQISDWDDSGKERDFNVAPGLTMVIGPSYLADWGNIVREEFNTPLIWGLHDNDYQDALNWISFFH